MSMLWISLQKRKNKNFRIDSSLWVCSNDPEICGYITNDLRGGKLSISKCPKCIDGYLIVKTFKHKDGTEAKMLGCTNYKDDKTGCNMLLMEHNYIDDKEKLNIMFYDEKTDLNNVTLCNHKYKEMVDAIVDVISFYDDLKVTVSPNLLFSILSGESNKITRLFKMYNNKWFGYITFDDRRKFFKLFSAMVDEKILAVDDNNFSKVIILKKILDENDYKIIYGSIKI